MVIFNDYFLQTVSRGWLSVEASDDNSDGSDFLCSSTQGDYSFTHTDWSHKACSAFLRSIDRYHLLTSFSHLQFENLYSSQEVYQILTVEVLLAIMVSRSLHYC